MALFTVALQVSDLSKPSNYRANNNPKMGPAVGPITSGFYQLKLNWRWNFYQLLWFGGFSLLLLPTIPETLPSRALMAKAKLIRQAKLPGYEHIQAPLEVQDRSLLQIFQVAILRPWQILFDPIAFLIGMALLRGDEGDLGTIASRALAETWPLMRAGQRMWPAVSIVSFIFVPLQWRTAFGGLAGIVEIILVMSTPNKPTSGAEGDGPVREGAIGLNVTIKSLFHIYSEEIPCHGICLK